MTGAYVVTIVATYAPVYSCAEGAIHAASAAIHAGEARNS